MSEIVNSTPDGGHEAGSGLESREIESTDLERAERWARRILGEYWDGEFPVDPNKIAVKMGMDVYFIPIPEGQEGVILRGKQDARPSIYIEKDTETSRKRFAIAHLMGHYVERLKESDDLSQEIGGPFGFCDATMTSDGQIMANPLLPRQSSQEIFADWFAHSLLIPKTELQSFIDASMSIEEAAIYFGVSRTTMRNRLNYLDKALAYKPHHLCNTSLGVRICMPKCILSLL